MAVKAAGAAGIVGPIPGADTATPISMSGQKFKSIAEFEKAVGRNGTVVLEPGKALKIKVGVAGIGGSVPSIGFGGVKKNPGFVSTVDKDGWLTITAKPGMKIGTAAKVNLVDSGPIVMNPKPATRFPFVLQVGIGEASKG